MPINIGLTMNYHFSEDNIERAYLDHTYLDAFSGYDVLCRPLHPVEDIDKARQYLETVSGIIFTGGLDLDTTVWNIPQHPKSVLVHKRRQQYEQMLLKLALEMRIPILGICLGLQTINMCLGGKISQHIPDANGSVDHGYDGEKTNHTVSLHPDSMLKQWMSDDIITVPSAHHQGITAHGDGLIAAAVADDGIIEAVEMPDYPFLLAVQWHPEKEPDSKLSRAILKAFLAKTQLFKLEKGQR